MITAQKTEELIKAFMAAANVAKVCAERLDEATERFEAAQEELAKWLTPADAEPGEQFVIWYGSRMLVVKDGEVSWRKSKLSQSSTNGGNVVSLGTSSEAGAPKRS